MFKIYTKSEIINKVSLCFQSNDCKNLYKANCINFTGEIKDTKENYSKVIGLYNYDDKKIKESIKIIKEKAKEYEFRTTIIKDYHSIENIENILKYIGKDSNYYLQKFILSDNVPDKKLSTYTDEELKEMVEKLSKNYPKIKLRGIKN